VICYGIEENNIYGVSLFTGFFYLKMDNIKMQLKKSHFGFVSTLAY